MFEPKMFKTTAMNFVRELFIKIASVLIRNGVQDDWYSSFEEFERLFKTTPPPLFEFGYNGSFGNRTQAH